MDIPSVGRFSAIRQSCGFSINGRTRLHRRPCESSPAYRVDQGRDKAPGVSSPCSMPRLDLWPSPPPSDPTPQRWTTRRPLEGRCRVSALRRAGSFSAMATPAQGHASEEESIELGATHGSYRCVAHRHSPTPSPHATRSPAYSLMQSPIYGRLMRVGGNMSQPSHPLLVDAVLAAGVCVPELH